MIAKELGSIHPYFLEDQLNWSWKNLGLDTIDVYYLHNPYETYGVWVSMEDFMKKLGKAFEFLESKRAEGVIKNYGMATYICLRSKSSEDKLHLNL